jgi:general secretion pathway protein F
MPVYEYSALNVKGKKISGIIDADGTVAARNKLRTSGIFPISVLEVQRATVKKEIGRFALSGIFARVSPSEVAMATRQLSTLVGAGFPLVSAIDTLIPQTKSHTFKKILAQIKSSITEGNSFAETLSTYPGTFTPLYVNMVHAGETSGTLEIVLERLADITEKQEAFKNRVRTALAYPLLMSMIGALVLFLLLTYIVPNITVIFTDMNQALPAPTLFLITVSDTLKVYWWVGLIPLAAVILTIRSLKKTAKGRRLIDKTKLVLPITGPLAKKLAAARFSRTLGSLLENGVSMLPALGIVKNIVGNVMISDAVEAAAQEVEKGQGLGTSLGAFNLFPNLCIQMIQVGEQSGELESMLSKVADVFENEVESTIMRTTALLEPVMILVMGVIVGFIVLSICLPIFEMNQLVR